MRNWNNLQLSRQQSNTHRDGRHYILYFLGIQLKHTVQDAYLVISQWFFTLTVECQEGPASADTLVRGYDTNERTHLSSAFL